MEYIREAKREAKAKADADVLSQPAAEEPAHYASNGRDGPSDRGVPMDRVASNNLKSTGEEEIEEKIPAVSRSSSRSSIWDIDRERENLPSFKGIDMDVIKASSTALTRPECKEGDLPFHDDGIPVLKDKWVENRMMEIFRDMGAVPKKPGKTLYSRVTRTSAPGPFRPDYKQFDGTLQIGQFYANDAAPYPAINPPPKEKGSKYVDPEDVPRKRHPIHVPIYYNNEGIPPAPIKDDDSAQFMEQMKGTASVSEDSSITRFGIKDPFVRMGYPDRFEEIREVRVGPLPEQDVGVGSIFSQITSGQIDKVYCDRENNCISIVFVEPRAARKEYIRIFNHDIFILGSNEGYQCSEAHHTRHLLMKALPFIYTHRSAPMMPQFSKAVTNGLTRILVLTGNVKHITEAGLTKDIMCIIPGLNTPRDVIECIDISDSAGEVAINFMSLYYSAKVATTLVGTIGYKGLVFSYAQDTCDWLKLEKKEMMPRRPLVQGIRPEAFQAPYSGA